MSAVRKYINRNRRLQSQPDKFRGFVLYKTAEPDAVGMAAQFSDISNTGMRLISRFRTPVKLGDLVTVEFELPGAETKLNLLGSVTRKLSDFDFAVHFVIRDENEENLLNESIKLYAGKFGTGWTSRTVERLADWTIEHKRGLLLSLIGFILIGAIVTIIFFDSDEYLGKPLKSWGEAYPKQWFIDYVKHFN
jgi:hypothetical protein